MANSRKGAPDPRGRVAACLRKYLPSGGRLTVGYSGGLDSSVLLHLLADSRPASGVSLSALHVHHNLSPRADAWAVHCESVCRGLDVPLVVARVDVIEAGEGPEAAARAARYREFARLDTDALALAHHRDDQAETVLAQLLRGGGAKALAAMPESRRLAGGRIQLLRPLLDISRVELMAWAEARGLRWVEDESNLQTHLTRNALRHRVLPEIEACFPGAGAGLARAARRFGETATLLDDLADLDGRDALDATGLAIERLAALPESRARNLLRRYLDQAGATIHPETLREGLRQLLEARAEARVEMAFGPVRLHRYRGRALAVPNPAHSSPARGVAGCPLVWRGETDLDLGQAGRLHFQRVAEGGVRLGPESATIRLRQGGETLRPDPRRPRRAVKDLLREAGIPPWRRERLPMILVGERLAWVAEIGSDADFRTGPGEPGWRISWFI